VLPVVIGETNVGVVKVWLAAILLVTILEIGIT
jgi:hypothetical protein